MINPLVAATPNPDCPECQRSGPHHPDKHVQYHPRTGHGTNGKAGCVCGNSLCPYLVALAQSSPVETQSR